MREASRERRSIVEAERLAILALLDGLLESVDVPPVLKDGLFLSSELKARGQVVCWENSVRVEGRHVESLGLGLRLRCVQSFVQARSDSQGANFLKAKGRGGKLPPSVVGPDSLGPPAGGSNQEKWSPFKVPQRWTLFCFTCCYRSLYTHTVNRRGERSAGEHWAAASEWRTQR